MEFNTSVTSCVCRKYLDLTPSVARYPATILTGGQGNAGLPERWRSGEVRQITAYSILSLIQSRILERKRASLRMG
jgi:hypothetical protein